MRETARETARAQEAWADYAAQNVSLAALAASYQERAARGERVPTTLLSTLKSWSAAFRWQERLEEVAQERIRVIMTSGLALAHERVAREKQVEQMLFDEVMDESKRWVSEPKWMGGVEGHAVDLVRFNHRLVEQWRGLHKDLAEETGGRKHVVEHQGRDGGPIEIKPVDYRTAVGPLLTDDHEPS